jgi:phosphatidylglycerophosphate synthase
MGVYYDPQSKMMWNLFWILRPRHRTMYPFAPDMVTVMATIILFPALWCLYYDYLKTAAVICMLHEFLDNADGAIARICAKQAVKRNGDFGAYFDAMADKIFTVGMWLGI